MTRLRASLLIVACLAASARCSSTRESCNFSYNTQMENQIARPLVTKGCGSQRAAYYDFENPVATKKLNTVTLLFYFDFEKQFRENRLIAVDPPYWGIDLDACTLRVIDSSEVSGTVISNHR